MEVVGVLIGAIIALICVGIGLVVWEAVKYIKKINAIIRACDEQNKENP